jgi:hypothetical protein
MKNLPVAYYKKISVKKPTKGSKRIDLCTAQTAHLLYLSQRPSIKEKKVFGDRLRMAIVACDCLSSVGG